MPIFHIGGKNVLFIHIPRTGGTTIERSFSSLYPMSFFSFGKISSSAVTPQHYTKGDIDAMFAKGYFDYAFTIVRDPYQRIESEYKLNLALAQASFWEGSPSFSQWLDSNLLDAQSNRHHADNHFRPQTDFIGDGLNVFRFEHGLSHILRYVSDELKVNIPMLQDAIYSTHKISEPVEWKSDDIHRVNEFYSSDLSSLSYNRRDLSIRMTDARPATS